jgi:hypothetical protein
MAEATLVDLKVNPSVPVLTCLFVFVDELIGDARDFDASIFGIGHRSIQVKGLKVNGAKAGTFLREENVEKELEKLQQRCVCTLISKLADAIATNGDPCAIRVILFYGIFLFACAPECHGSQCKRQY